MGFDPQQSPLFTHIDVSQASTTDADGSSSLDIACLLQQLVNSQNRQNELLEDLVQHMSAVQKQRANEINQWKDTHPYLSKRCRQAAEALSNVQTEFLNQITDEITENADSMMEGEFMLNEFVDRFGPRLAHLNGVLQVMSQLSAASNSQPDASRRS